MGLIYTKEINPNNTFCADFSQFIIQGPSEVAAKLNNIETHHLKQVRPQSVVPSHDEYMSIVQSLAFVVLNQPISTHCTIGSDVHDKVVGKPAKGKGKAKAGQGDFQSREVVLCCCQRKE